MAGKPRQGDSGGGNTSVQRGRPPTRRIVLDKETARRLAEYAPEKDEAIAMVNIIVSQWLDEHNDAGGARGAAHEEQQP